MVPKIIGLAGKSGAGKDWSADLLCHTFGYRKVSVAAPIRAEFEAWLTLALKECALADGFPESFSVVVEAFREAVWSKPTTPAMRVALQWYGTDFRREQNPNYWTPPLKAHLSTGERITVPDIRIPLEVDIVHSVGGEVWYIDRPGLAPVGLSGHRTENSLTPSDCDRVISNHGSLVDLQNELWSVFGEEMRNVNQSIHHHSDVA